MKISKVFLSLVILFAAQITWSQESVSQSKLVDEFGALNCEDILGRMDNFMINLNDSPGSVGYVIIHPKKGATKEGFTRESWIKGSIHFRKFDKTRLLILRGEEEDAFRAQYWLVPAGATKPELKEGKWSYYGGNIQKAFVFYSIFVDSSCPADGSFDGFAEFLRDNPGTRANIVIFNKPTREARKEVDDYIKTITKDGRLSSDRFKVFFAKNNGFSDVEFWVLPAKEKK